MVFTSIQKSYPVYSDSYGPKFFRHLSLQDIGAHPIQHVTEPVIDLWEEHGFIDACGVFKGDEFHGISFFGVYGLSGDQPPDGGDLFSHPVTEISGRDMTPFPDDMGVTLKGMEREEKPEGFEFMF